MAAQPLKRLPLACCKIYISDTRNAVALQEIESTFRVHPKAPLLHTFEDHEYNRVGYTLAGNLQSLCPPLFSIGTHASVGASLDIRCCGARRDAWQQEMRTLTMRVALTESCLSRLSQYLRTAQWQNSSSGGGHGCCADGTAHHRFEPTFRKSSPARGCRSHMHAPTWKSEYG